ncbi:ABC-2 family transporter protein [Clostridiaceae bacterium M8S5]|nr:ABC-2 family transporter protein [Clostridiaceae bacterium M8S5]
MNTIFGIFPLIIQYFLWTAIYKYSNSKTISGYNLMMMIQYFICVFFLTQITFPRQIARSISSDILSGDLNAYLIKPFGYLKMKFIEHIANRFVSISILLIPISIYVVIFNKNIGIANAILAIVFLINAFIAQFLIYCILGMSVFWTEESSNLMDLWGMIGGVLAGSYIPYTIIPVEIRSVLLFLPFKYLVYYPISVLVEENINYLEVLISWISSLGFLTVLFGVVIVMWKKGLKKYSAFGM